MLRCIAVFFALLVFLWTAPRLSQAQVLHGSLTGNVTDATWSVVPGAKVEALNGATGQFQADHLR